MSGNGTQSGKVEKQLGSPAAENYFANYIQNNLKIRGLLYIICVKKIQSDSDKYSEKQIGP